MSLLVVENIHFECWGGLQSTIMVMCSVYIGSNEYSDSKLDDGGEGDIVSYFSNRYKMKKKKMCRCTILARPQIFDIIDCLYWRKINMCYKVKRGEEKEM